jgi:16S rRNA (cytosine1402-N4)-methyltransferase
VLNFVHKPVLFEEVLKALEPASGGRYLDGTVGGGGHAGGILRISAPEGWLYGCDRDETAVEAARERLGEYEGRFEIRQMRFDEVGGWIGVGVLDGVLLDLGVSSPQLDVGERGFSFQSDGPLDMRMDRSRGMTAAEFLRTADVEEMARVFWELGGESESRRLAREIDRARRSGGLQTTRQLAELIERWKPRRGARLHPATRVFQALRMVVNDELGCLERGLEVVWGCLKVGGRLAVITFHSGEDRMVKQFGRLRARDYTVDGPVDVPLLRHPAAPELIILTRKAIKPGAAEEAANPRARSAQLRVFEKLR